MNNNISTLFRPLRRASVGVICPDGNFYGVTVAGGANGSGTVFRLAFPTLSILRSGSTSVSSWPTNQVGFSLEWMTNLAPPNGTTLTNVGGWGVSLWCPMRVGGTRGFYNLVK